MLHGLQKCWWYLRHVKSWHLLVFGQHRGHELDHTLVVTHYWGGPTGAYCMSCKQKWDYSAENGLIDPPLVAYCRLVPSHVDVDVRSQRAR